MPTCRGLSLASYLGRYVCPAASGILRRAGLLASAALGASHTRVACMTELTLVVAETMERRPSELGDVGVPAAACG